MTRRGEEGSAIVEFLWLTLLLMVPLVYIVVSIFGTQAAAYGSSAAARGAVRAFLTAPDEVTGRVRAEAAVRAAFADQGVAGPTSLELRCTPDPSRCLTPGSVVHAIIRARVRLPLVPSVFGHQAPSIAITAEHAAPYGEFRQARP